MYVTKKWPPLANEILRTTVEYYIIIKLSTTTIITERNKNGVKILT